MGTWVDHLAIRVEGPKGVAEQVVRVVHLLDLNEARPIFTVTAFGPFGRFVTAEELVERTHSVSMKRRTGRARTLGYGPPS